MIRLKKDPADPLERPIALRWPEPSTEIEKLLRRKNGPSLFEFIDAERIASERLAKLEILRHRIGASDTKAGWKRVAVTLAEGRPAGFETVYSGVHQGVARPASVVQTKRPKELTPDLLKRFLADYVNVIFQTTPPRKTEVALRILSSRDYARRWKQTKPSTMHGWLKASIDLWPTADSLAAVLEELPAYRMKNFTAKTDMLLKLPKSAARPARKKILPSS